MVIRPLKRRRAAVDNDSVWIALYQDDLALIQTNLDFDRDHPVRRAIAEGRDITPEDLPMEIFGKYEDDPVG